MLPIFRGRADIIGKVLVRDRILNNGILPSVYLTKQKRAAKPVTSVCSRLKRLTSDQTKGRKSLRVPQRKRERRQKCCG